MKPPDDAIEAALAGVARSPCAKSKRGVAIFTVDVFGHTMIESIGYNRPPSGIGCDGSNACRESCSRRCVHAEMAALRSISRQSRAFNISEYELVHVKLSPHGGVEAGGGPSCWQCSREILDVGIGRVWLYEAANGPAWKRYTAEEFHRVTCANAKGGAVY